MSQSFRPATLGELLRWAANTYAAETPTLGHSASETDAGGAPEMRPAPKAWLGLAARQRLDTNAKPEAERADDWVRLACRTSEEGVYLTPMRCALARIRNPEQRAFMRDLLTSHLFPADIAVLHGIPLWTADIVAYRCLVQLRDRYLDRPPAPTRWTSLSESSQRAIEAGERGEAA